MATVAQVREALAKYIEDTTGLECKPRMPDQVNPPMAAIMPGAPFVTYGVTMSANLAALRQVNAPVEMNVAVLIITSKAGSTERAQLNIDAYLGLDADDSVTSIPVALALDPTLGGMVEYAEPVSVTTYGQIEVAGQIYFGARLAIQISVAQDLGA